MPGIEIELEGLKPAHDNKIMDLVEAAGVDVAPWAFTQDGRPVKVPQSNPSYCYEWAFGGGKEPTVLCVWHRSIATDADRIVYLGSVRDYALRLDPMTFDRSQPAHVRSRARDQAKRARKFDSLLQHAYRKSEPVRIVLLDGEAKDRSELGWDSSTVDVRRLDSMPWYVHSYSDDDGTFNLVRSIPAPIGASTNPPRVVYADQFSIPPPQGKVPTAGSAYPRSADVRNSALMRAAGVCEFCKIPGFVMLKGAIYLETHHVVPLGEGGPDIEWNVVALCPNDHRRAHFAKERDGIQSNLIGLLSATYPAAAGALATLAQSKIDESVG